MTVMAVNDLVWVIFWVLFFRRVGSLHGWDGDRILLLLAVLCTAAGAALGIFANARQVGRMVVEGELDAVLALPVPPLAHLLLRRIEPVNLGDVVFGLMLFVATGTPTLERTAIFLAVVAGSITLLVGFLVLAGSLAFFAGRSETGEMGFHAMLLLSSYPVDMFAGTAKVVLYSVLPAAFVAAVPARLVDSFDTGQALALFGSALAFAVAAWATFRIGLRRYTSGAVWTRA
jgi:ABC-2 type transport system permease protein